MFLPHKNMQHYNTGLCDCEFHSPCTVDNVLFTFAGVCFCGYYICEWKHIITH